MGTATSTIRKAAFITAAAALIAFPSTKAVGQQQLQAVPQVTRPSPFADAAAEEAYKAKMRRVISLASTLAPDISETCAARALAFIEDVKKYNRDPRFQGVLVALSEETLNNYARYVNCTDKDDSKIRTVNSVQEDGWRALMVANGIIPNSPPIYGPAYQAAPTAPDAARQRRSVPNDAPRR